MGVHLWPPNIQVIINCPKDCKRWQKRLMCLVNFHISQFSTMKIMKVPPFQKMARFPFYGLFWLFFGGRFDTNLRGVLHGFRLISHKTPSMVSQLAMHTLGFVKFLWQGREIWVVGHLIGMKSSPVSTITFLGKNKDVKQNTFFSKNYLFRSKSKYFLVIVKNRSSADPKNRIQEHCNQKLHTANLSKMAAQQKGPVHPVHLTVMKHPTKRRLRCFA